MKPNTSRSGSVQKNGHRRSNSRYSNGSNTANTANSANSNSSSPLYVVSSQNDEIGNNRLLYLVTKSIGKSCVATITNGARYQGLLVSADLSPTGSSALSVVLMNPVNVGKSLIAEKSNIDSNGDHLDKLIIQSKDLIDLEVIDVDLAESFKNLKSPKQHHSPAPQIQVQSTPAASVASNEESKFKTDTDISGRTQFKERELQRWVPDEDIDHPALNFNSNDTFGESSTGQWDQFKVNEEKFGVEASYDEHLYTTRINTSAPDYHERVAKAEKLAREIELLATTDRHILEERGLQVDDSGIDEEDKYSGVDRRGDELMAALRNASISNDSSVPVPPLGKQVAGKYVTPRQRAAQYHNDPAIISSSATSISKATPPPESPDKLETVEKTVGKTGTVEKAQKPETKVPEDVAGVSVAKAAKNTVPVKPDSIPAKPQVSQQPHNESFRLNAQSEINSLREFSANFKIPHKMPSDLLPILTKDKLKQDEILKKQEQKKLQNEIEATSASQSQSNSEAQSQSQSPSKAKIDVAKPTFKLNPKAAAFTPASKHTQISPTPPKASYHRSPNNPSPRMNHQRPFSNGSVSSGSSVKRHHQISPADFFGGADRIPTKESQIKKVESFQFAFNLFVTTRKRHAEKNEKSEKKSDTVVYDKTFQTPPTWDSTFDDTHDKLFPALSYVNGSSVSGNGSNKAGGPMVMPTTSPFIPSPMLAAPAIPNAYGGAPAGSKYPVSPHQQQAAAAAMAAHFQQQQFHAAMMYQQQFPVGIPPGQPPMHMYPGGEPPFMPPGGFMPPPGGFVAGGSPVNGNMMLNPYNAGGHNYNSHHHSGRRYNSHHQNRRGGHS